MRAVIDPNRPNPMRSRDGVVELARRHLAAQTPAADFWRDVLGPTWVGPFPPHWCGAFALSCLREAGLTDWTWQIGKGFLWRLKRTTDPQPGDIGYQDAPFQHHFVVADVGDLTLTSIDGNQGKPGIQERHRAKANPGLAFYSIEQLLPKQEP